MGKNLTLVYGILNFTRESFNFSFAHSVEQAYEHSKVANETLCWLMVPLRVVGQEKKKYWNTLEVIQFDVLKHK